MKVISTHISDVKIIEPAVFEDARGYFYESYNQQQFAAAGISTQFVQDNQSRSAKGVLRGLHYQVDPMAQAKLVRVLEGVVMDVAVDIRKGSPTYGKHVAIELSASNRKQLFIPRGFAHGFAVLSEVATFFYKCDNFYAKQHEQGIRFDDPLLAIDWGMDPSSAILSDKDRALPSLEAAIHNFEYQA